MCAVGERERRGKSEKRERERGALVVYRVGNRLGMGGGKCKEHLLP